MIGGILHFTRQTGLPTYPTMFTCVATGLVFVAIVFAARTRVRIKPEPLAAHDGISPDPASTAAESSPCVAS